VHVGNAIREEGGDDVIISVYATTRAGSDPTITPDYGTTGFNGFVCFLLHDPDGDPSVSAFDPADASSNPITLVPSVAVPAGGAVLLFGARYVSNTWNTPTDYTAVSSPFTEIFAGYRLSAPDPSAPSLVGTGGADHGAAIAIAIAPGAAGLGLSSSSPSDNATDIAIGADITITYTSAISDSGAGAYYLRKVSDSSLVQSFSAGQFSIAGATVTLNPSADLLPSTEYYVEADANVVKRTTDNAPSPAISGATSLNFTTAAAPETDYAHQVLTVARRVLDPTDFVVSERFVTGVTTGIIGSAGWRITNTGTATDVIQASTLHHPGTLRLVTGTTSGNNKRLHLSNAASEAPFDPTGTRTWTWVVRVPTITTLTIRLGLMQDISAASGGTAGAFWQFDPSVSANWQAFTRQASTSSPAADSGVPVVADNWYKLEARREASGNWRFLLNNAPLVAIATNLPTTACNFGALCQTNTTAARNLDLGYCAFHHTLGQLWT
jgi:hypothetical protein